MWLSDPATGTNAASDAKRTVFSVEAASCEPGISPMHAVHDKCVLYAGLNIGCSKAHGHPAMLHVANTANSGSHKPPEVCEETRGTGMVAH